MPIYEYRCADCSHQFEKLMRRSGETTTCPSCASGAVEKQISTFAVSTSATGSSPSMSCGAPAEGCGASACGGGSCGMAN